MQTNVFSVIRCPFCENKHLPSNISLLEGTTYFCKCTKCKLSQVMHLTLLPHGQGVVITRITDLKKNEILKKMKNDLVSENDVLDVHAELESGGLT